MQRARQGLSRDPTLPPGGVPDKAARFNNLRATGVFDKVGHRALRFFYRGPGAWDDEPFGAACMPAGVSPSGLDAGAPPDVVAVGPVLPWGWL
jgi:hypothetical protein